jgi:hypothetical protein
MYEFTDGRWVDNAGEGLRQVRESYRPEPDPLDIYRQWRRDERWDYSRTPGMPRRALKVAVGAAVIVALVAFWFLAPLL